MDKFTKFLSAAYGAVFAFLFRYELEMNALLVILLALNLVF